MRGPHVSLYSGHWPADREDDRGPDHAHARHSGRSGVPILEALAIVRETCTNMVFERLYQRVYESIREGDTIAQPMKESKLVDDMVINMIDIGEETGDLDSMLYKVADVYDEEVAVLVESLISLLEPMMVVVLGLIIGSIVIALFVPMLSLLDSLSK